MRNLFARPHAALVLCLCRNPVLGHLRGRTLRQVGGSDRQPQEAFPTGAAHRERQQAKACRGAALSLVPESIPEEDHLQVLAEFWSTPRAGHQKRRIGARSENPLLRL